MVRSGVFVFLLVTLGLAQGQAASTSVPSGTTLHCRLTQTLATQISLRGEKFNAAVSEPVAVNGREVIPRGSTIQGRIAQMAKPGRIRGVGEMLLVPEKVTLADGKSYSLSALLVSTYGADGVRIVGTEGQLRGPSSRLRTFSEIGAGAAGGGVVGMLFSHPVLGMTIGGAAGFVDRARRRGKDLVLPSGTELNYQLTRSLEIEP